ncbi:MAG TPA: dTDP-4-dehydrorhamnose 3,5-epimerase family protein [Acidimicrobiales bacterium]|nr:dTDP-4-dehydrorhamnose 3,5-epimerase family protein [Acidimicrobiales bacterium]
MALRDFHSRPGSIAGLSVIATRQVSDERGTVRELYRTSRYELEIEGAAGPWAQINLTHSIEGAIRGLHGEETTKLVGVAAGAAFGAYVDARPDSPTFGVVETVALEVGVQVLVPRGVLNGFQAVGGGCEYLYCFDAEWRPDMPGVGVDPLDPELAIAWPVAVDRLDRTRLSEKDAGLPPFSALAASR